MNPIKLEHGLGTVGAGIPFTVPQGYEDNDLQTFASTV